MRDIVVRGCPNFSEGRLNDENKSQGDFSGCRRRRAAGISGDGEANSPREAVSGSERRARFRRPLRGKRRRSLYAVRPDFAVRCKPRFPKRKQRLATFAQIARAATLVRACAPPIPHPNLRRYRSCRVGTEANRRHGRAVGISAASHTAMEDQACHVEKSPTEKEVSCARCLKKPFRTQNWRSPPMTTISVAKPIPLL